jgi:chromosome segregation protein
MILKRLTATGFKSFADRTELDFGPGITGIVGPNGCGKSNVVDAIKWVLGEQSAKSLRGKQMMDVIFNGSGTRKSMSMAQVDLTFDNTDGTLPVDQTEVVVARRLYRSGESEYLLNKQVCRLKDIRELFLDTGIGVDAYSVIEQGRVDVLLQANPAERRMIFEEAAGISKYKVRKKEAQRRLERVNQNLLRVQDIVDEVEKRLRSVKLAAGKARNYQQYVQQLRELRSRYALAEFHRLRTTQTELDRETTELSDQTTRLRTELSDNDARSSDANVRIVELDREISRAESELLSAAAQVSAAEERIAAAKRRIEDQTDLLNRSEERLGGFDQQLATSTARIDEQSTALQRIEQDLHGVHSELAGLQETDRLSAHELNEAQRQIEDEKAGIIDLLRKTSQLSNEISGLGLQHETLVKQKAALDERDAAIAGELATTMSRQAELRAREQEIDRLVAEQTRTLEDTRARSETISAERIAITEQHAAAKEYRSGLESRRDVLAELDRKHDGLLAGAREILEKRDASDAADRPFAYVLGPVGEIFEVDVAHASLVEAVLGSFEKYLVVTRRDLLLADKDSLSELSGPLRAFCLDHIPPVIAGPDLSGQDGIIARMIDWARYPETCERLARHLLGRTYVVESIDDARRLSAMDGAARFVTMSGIVWEADGRIAAGPLGSGSGLISRRSELRELSQQITEVEQRIADLGETLAERASEITHLEEVQTQLRAALYDANTHRVEARAQLATIDETVRQLSQERPLIASEISILVNHLAEMQSRREAEQAALGQLQQQSDASHQRVGELQTRIDELTRQRGTIAEQITADRVRAGELTQQRASMTEALREMQAAAIQLQADRAQAERDVIEARARIEQSGRQIEEAQKNLEQLQKSRDELTTRSAAYRQDRENQRSIVDQCAAEARSLRASLEAAEASLHQQQIKLQEVRIRAEDLVARIAEELSVNLEEQYAGYEPETHEDWPAVEAEMTDLRQKIERLGNVNIDAIDEQSQLETRQTFLTTQLDDLRSSETQLLTLIEKLNAESQQRFMETFKAVAEHFTALFKKLFGGGKAELTLMDENDVLECGIEIMARPPGKEPQSISLLSGGEKTMTAIALLLAVFRSRPSPFVLLDEVDAALDEANNVRFNHVIREFTELSQFILITHSKRTMSIADVLYGITMQEAGVSQRVGVRFDDDRQAVA